MVYIAEIKIDICSLYKCVVPENIHTPHTEVIRNSGGKEISRVCIKGSCMFLRKRTSFVTFTISLLWGIDTTITVKITKP